MWCNSGRVCGLLWKCRGCMECRGEEYAGGYMGMWVDMGKYVGVCGKVEKMRL